MYDRDALIELIRDKALKIGKFILASGKEASYYLDCRQVTLRQPRSELDRRGNSGTAWARASPTPSEEWRSAPIRSPPPSSRSPANAAWLLNGFIVRKEPKGHGRGRDVEGPVQAGQKVVIVEDVVTTGGSSLKAIERVEACGLKVQEVIAIVDRLEGGREAFRGSVATRCGRC